MKFRILLALLLWAQLVSLNASPSFELHDGDRVVFIGDTFMEREQYYGHIELALAAQFPDSKITFRNLGWSGA